MSLAYKIIKLSIYTLKNFKRLKQLNRVHVQKIMVGGQCMDHVMDYISEYMESDADELKEEYKSGKYSKLSDCPSYGTVKAYCEAYNILAKAWYHSQYVKAFLITPKKIVEV